MARRNLTTKGKEYKFLVLDTYPLTNAAIPFAKLGAVPSESEQCRQWMADCEAAGKIILVPAICCYEGVRDLFQRQTIAKIAQFQNFCLETDHFIPLTTAHLTEAGKLWGQLRRTGQATSDPHALDGDCILAAQVLSLGLPPEDFVVVTRNPKHLTRLGLPAEAWETIAA